MTIPTTATTQNNEAQTLHPELADSSDSDSEFLCDEDFAAVTPEELAEALDASHLTLDTIARAAATAIADTGAPADLLAMNPRATTPKECEAPLLATAENMVSDRPDLREMRDKVVEEMNLSAGPCLSCAPTLVGALFGQLPKVTEVEHECYECEATYVGPVFAKAYPFFKYFKGLCPKCLGEHCYAKSVEGYLMQTPLGTVHRADIKRHARLNRVCIVLWSPRGYARIGDPTLTTLYMRVDAQFTHAYESSMTPHELHGHMPYEGPIALATPHSVKEIIAGVARLPRKTTAAFYNDEDRARTKLIKEKTAAPCPTVQPTPPRPSKRRPRPVRRRYDAAPRVPEAPPQAGTVALAGIPKPVPNVSASYQPNPTLEEMLRAEYTSTDYAFEPVIARASVLHGERDYGWEASSFGIQETAPPGDFKAARFMANTVMPSTVALATAAGAVSDLPHLMEQLLVWLKTDGPLPLRFGDSCAHKKTIADGVLVLSVDNYTEGDTIYLFTQTLQANRGVYILSMAPNGTSFSSANFIGSITPNIDVEKIGAMLNVLGTRLQVSIQQSTGADSTVKAFSNIVEWGVSTVFPVAVLPGKLRYSTASRRALREALTSDGALVCDNTAPIPDNLVRLGTAFDVQSNEVVRVKHVNQPASANITGGQRYSLQAFATTDNTVNDAMGFSVDVNTSLTASGQEVWRMSNHSSFLRHMMTDAFTLDFSGMYIFGPPAADTSDPIILTMVIDFIDGTTQSISRYAPIALSGLQTFQSFNFAGAGLPDQSAGKIITDIILRQTFQPLTQTCSLAHNTSLSLTFHSISAATRYPCVIITGAKIGQTLSITQSADVEVKIDPTSDIGRYIAVSHTAIPDHDLTAQLVRWCRDSGVDFLFTIVKGEVQWRAGGFGDRLRNFFGRVMKILAPVAAAGGRLLGARTGVTGLGRIAGQLANEVGDTLQAATFATAQRVTNTGYQFPMVSGDRTVGQLADVIKGNGPSPLFMRAFRQSYTSAPADFTGNSCDLAFLLAALAGLGAPSYPGVYSGEVRDLQVSRNSATFLLLPVACSAEKIALYKSNLLTIYGPEGFNQYGLNVDSSDLQAFANFRTAKFTPVEAPPGYPGEALRIALSWS